MFFQRRLNKLMGYVNVGMSLPIGPPIDHHQTIEQKPSNDLEMREANLWTHGVQGIREVANGLPEKSE